MTPVDEARTAVRTARRRLTGGRLLARGAQGLLWGSALGCALALGAVAFGVTPPAWSMAVAFAGVLAGLARALAQPLSEERAALALDHAAGTDEAFVSALTAQDAGPSFRALCAAYALDRCGRNRVAAVLPLEPPRTATAAAVAFALLAAIVLVPGASAAETDDLPAPDPIMLPGGTAPDGPTSPADRARALIDALESAAPADASALTPAVRRSVPALADEDIRALAEALAKGPDASVKAAAEEALAALAAGDRDGAAAALHAALGRELPASANSAGDGVGEPGSSDSTTGAPGTWSAPTWPLRYDRTVQRWFELRAAAEAAPGGPR